jgi:hypothetical protein
MSLTDRLDSTLSRVNSALSEQARRMVAAQQAEDAEQARADAAQAKADAIKRVEIAERYDEAFRAFGERVPMPAADERPGSYRKRLFETLRHRLPSDHEWASTRADDIPVSARNQIERMMISAAMAEAAKPSLENLPASGLVRRDLTNETTGAKEIHWHGRRSFIADMNREAGRVLRIIDPRRASC